MSRFILEILESLDTATGGPDGGAACEMNTVFDCVGGHRFRQLGLV
jgi:hypothetical protein